MSLAHNRMRPFEQNKQDSVTLLETIIKKRKMSNKSTQLSNQKLEKFKTIISESLKETSAELSKLKENHKTQKQKLAQTNVDFNQSSKHAPQQALNKQIINRFQRKSRELKSALTRIENKTYGVCNRTGQLIREERLMARPTALFDIKKK